MRKDEAGHIVERLKAADQCLVGNPERGLGLDVSYVPLGKRPLLGWQSGERAWSRPNAKFMGGSPCLSVRMRERRLPHVKCGWTLDPKQSQQ